MKVNGYDVFDEGGSWMVRKTVTPTNPDDEADYLECLVGKDKAATADDAVKFAIAQNSWS